MFGWKDDQTPVIETPMTTIHLVGVENVNAPNRPRIAGIRFYGRRENDAANRLVLIILSMRDAEEIIDYMSGAQDMPDIEVPSRSWAYVASVGPNEVKFKEPSP